MQFRTFVGFGLGLGLAFPSASPSAQCELQALRGRNTQPLDFFGKSCSIDGERLIVGAFASTTGRPGSAHIFELRSGRWEQVARFVPSDATGGDEFGNSVGISGNFAIGGAEYYTGAAGSKCGAAYIFERGADGLWFEAQKLEPHDNVRNHNFGEYVAIEGTVAVVGCRFDAELGNNAGAAYVFERNAAGTWVETAKLLGSAGKRNDLSGDTVAIHGGRIVMASYRSDASGGHSGSAYLFEKSGSAWKEAARLVANDGAGELSRGAAINGDRVVLGARLDSTMGGSAGAGYVFEKWNGQWIQTAKLLPSSARAGDWIGEAVAVQGDRIVLSGHFHDVIGSDSGAAFVFELQNGVWVETNMLVSSGASPNDAFSFALGFSGPNLVGTSPFDGGNVGGAYVFTFEEDLCGCGGTGGGALSYFGENLGGANIGRLESDSVPNSDTTLSLRVSQIPNGTTGTLFMAPVKQLRSGFGGTLLVPTSSAPIKLPFRLSRGTALVSWRVPSSLCGTTLYAQAGALDATQALGRALTNGLELRIGD